MACRGFHPATGRWRSDRAHPEQFVAAPERDRVSTFIGPGWLPEQLGSLHKAGSTKMTQTNITTAGIDTSKAKLDIAVHGRTERWQVANALPGWRALAANLAKAGVTRIGIEATGGYERGVVEHLRSAGFTVLLLQPLQVKAFRQGPFAPGQERRARRRIDRRLCCGARSA